MSCNLSHYVSFCVDFALRLKVTQNVLYQKYHRFVPCCLNTTFFCVVIKDWVKFWSLSSVMLKIQSNNFNCNNNHKKTNKMQRLKHWMCISGETIRTELLFEAVASDPCLFLSLPLSISPSFVFSHVFITAETPLLNLCLVALT